MTMMEAMTGIKSMKNNTRKEEHHYKPGSMRLTGYE